MLPTGTGGIDTQRGNRMCLERRSDTATVAKLSVCEALPPASGNVTLPLGAVSSVVDIAIPSGISVEIDLPGP